MDGKVMKIEDVENKLNSMKSEGYDLRMQTNPYNPGVAMVDYAKNEDWEPEFSITLEGLTNKTEERILEIVDKRIHARNR